VRSLRVALVGTGWIARDHLAALAEHEDTEVVAVCDVDEERAHSAAPSGATVYADWRELLDCEELDSLWICTPPLAHREPAVAALERGLPVYLEKPIARTVEDGATIVAAAEASEAPCAVGYQWHALELLDDLRTALDGQAVGLLAGKSIGPTQSRPWFLDRAQGGGQLLERASHHIDLQRAIAGDVERVQAASTSVELAERADGDVEPAISLILQFAGGGIGTIQVAWTKTGQVRIFGLDVVAADSTFQLELDPTFRLTGRTGERDVDADATTPPFQRSIGGFLEAVRARDRDAVFCTPRDALGTLAVATACEQALATGETVAVSELVAP
jgi:myo-inositol 2-dehydrogenase / D-chiro-inositol 1-dehydrogenase